MSGSVLLLEATLFCRVGEKKIVRFPCANKRRKKLKQKVLNVGMKLISYSARQIDAVTGFITLVAASGVGR